MNERKSRMRHGLGANPQASRTSGRAVLLHGGLQGQTPIRLGRGNGQIGSGEAREDCGFFER
jgi:hypothetical protein